MVKLNIGGGKLPKSVYGWTGFLCGIAACILAATQLTWDWFGKTNSDKIIYSLIFVVFSSLSIGFMFSANWRNINQMRAALQGTILVFIVIMVVIMSINGLAMSLDQQYSVYANNNEGIFTGFRMLTSITDDDVSSLERFALGVRQIVRAMFLVVPCLIATWGGLSVLTADSIDEAEGGILAIVAAFVVFLICWIFKAIDVSLMSLFISLSNVSVKSITSFKASISTMPSRILVMV